MTAAGQRSMPTTRKVVRRGRRRDDDDDYEDAYDRDSGGDDDDDQRNTLAAFSTQSRGARDRQAKATGKVSGGTLAKSTHKPKQATLQVTERHELIIPDVGTLSGIEDIKLCDDPKAGLDRHFEDTEKLLAAFNSLVLENEALLKKAVSFTEARLEKTKVLERKAAVEAAVEVAEQAAERKHAIDLRNAVTQAVAEARAAAQVAQEAAVAEALKLAEERSTELQRLAVQNVTSTYQRAVGRPEEEIIATRTTNSFQEAANAAAMALAASTRLELKSRDTGGDMGELISTETQRPQNALSTPAPAQADAALHFF